MKKALLVLMCVMLLTVALAPAALANPASMFVRTQNGGALNMRKTMVTGANNVVVKIPNGAVVDVLSNVNSTWAKCSYNNLTGYCMRRYLSMDKPSGGSSSGSTAPAELSNSMFSGMKACYYSVYVRPSHPTGFVNLRWAPSTAAKVHDKYYANAELIVMAENAHWCQVLDAQNNQMGFMMRSFLVQE